MKLASEIVKSLEPKIRKIISDNKWHRFPEFLELGDEVPPEVASRKFLAQVNKERREKAKDRPIDEQIEMGRRNVVAKKLQHMVRIGELEKRGDGFNREYRIIRDPDSEDESEQNAFLDRQRDILGIDDNEQFIVDLYDESKRRAKKMGMKLEYNSINWFVVKDDGKKKFNKLGQVSAFLDGVEWANES